MVPYCRLGALRNRSLLLLALSLLTPFCVAVAWVRSIRLERRRAPALTRTTP